MWRPTGSGLHLAGAIFTEEEIAFLMVIFVGMVAVGLALLVVFLRSAARLFDKARRTQNDFVIVGIGVFIVATQLIGSGADRFSNWRTDSALGDEAAQAIDPVTQLPPDAFLDGRRWDLIECDAWVIPIEVADPADAIVSREADAFERAGWTVTRYAPTGSHRSAGFRADRAGQPSVALRAQSGTDLEYVYAPNECATRGFKLDLGRTEIESL